MKTLGIIQDCEISLLDDGSVLFVADADIDSDGSPNLYNDPWWQAETSLRYRGKSIPSIDAPYVVVPPLIIKAVPGIVLGCHAQIRNLRNGRTIEAVVADVGPTKKIGELSIQAARLLGINSHPVRGGESERKIEYRIFPGKPAKVNGIVYDLQPS